MKWNHALPLKHLDFSGRAEITKLNRRSSWHMPKYPKGKHTGEFGDKICQ